MRHSPRLHLRRVRALVTALLLMASLGLSAGTATAVTDPDEGGGPTNPDGTILRTFTAASPYCSVGTGIAFTGEYLLLSCWDVNELYVIDPTDGRLVNTLQVTGTSEDGLGALAYDRRNDALYACTWPSERVLAIHPTRT